MRAKMILLVAILFGIASTLLLINFLGDLEAEKKVATDTIDVFVAVRAIEANEIITKDMIVASKIAKEYMNSGYATKKEDLINKLSLAYIARNEVISKKRVLDTENDSKYLSQKIKDSYIGVTLDVDNENSVGQLIMPNDYIDIIYSQVVYVDDMNNVFYNTSVVFEKIKVLSIDRKLYFDSLTEAYVPYESITLEMTKEQGRLLVNYKLQGEIDITLNSRIAKK